MLLLALMIALAPPTPVAAPVDGSKLYNAPHIAQAMLEAADGLCTFKLHMSASSKDGSLPAGDWVETVKVSCDLVGVLFSPSQACSIDDKARPTAFTKTLPPCPVPPPAPPTPPAASVQDNVTKAVKP